jgi:hypothetical protein
MRPNNSLKIRLSGRFGNQIFQVCEAIFLSKQLNEPLLISAKGTRPQNLKILYESNLLTREELELSKIQSIYLQGSALGLLLDKIIAFYYLIEHKFRNFRILERSFFRYGKKVNYIADNQWKKIATFEGDVYGYFQDYSLVQEVWDDIKSRFLNSKLYFPDANSRNKIYLHIRLTDYLLLPEIGNLSEQYYLNCLERLPKFQAVVFTDDSKKFRQNFGKLSKIVKFNMNNEDPFMSFRTMANSRYLIIANSSFSYWAGIFSIMGNPEARVISPMYWRFDGKKNEVICPKFQLEENDWH